jgi:hypothetical protein
VKVPFCPILPDIRNSVAVVECRHASLTGVSHDSSIKMKMIMELRFKLKNSVKACFLASFQRQTSHRLLLKIKMSKTH